MKKGKIRMKSKFSMRFVAVVAPVALLLSSAAYMAAAAAAARTVDAGTKWEVAETTTLFS